MWLVAAAMGTATSPFVLSKGARQILVALGVLAIVMMVARRILFPMPMDRCQRRQFASAPWQDSAQAFSPSAIRGCMVNHLLKRYALVGMARDSVIRLLGAGDRTNYFKEYDLVYWLGPERGWMSIDSEWLVLRINNQGWVAEARIVTD
jgi:hypothetical protein